MNTLKQEAISTFYHIVECHGYKRAICKCKSNILCEFNILNHNLWFTKWIWDNVERNIAQDKSSISCPICAGYLWEWPGYINWKMWLCLNFCIISFWQTYLSVNKAQNVLNLSSPPRCGWYYANENSVQVLTS